ncbi:MAG: RpiB/LacA/LacB family sugar-phosphate isomerase [Rickettsiales bacterium]|jgi:ribose 5-phosphate isomerase B|nr:RpiB/LacA/LacB family sugar-phosphate isomerase [Rickettsiales bacterium]
MAISNTFTRFIFGSDHAGFVMKNFLKSYIAEKFPNAEIVDVGTHTEESCDTSDFADAVAKELKTANDDAHNLGILICGTGIGMSMAANRYRHIRGALVHNEFTAQMAREHSNANVLIMGSRVIGEDTAIKCLDKFLESMVNTEPKYAMRLAKIS